MRRLIGVVLVLCLLLPSLALAKTNQEQSIPDFCKPILESWGATNEKELQANIVAYWKECAPEFRRYSSADQMKTSICFGGTTDDLIKNSTQWDLAIVSSKDVDLQRLADEGLIERIPFVPEDYVVQHQRLLPKAVQSMLPSDPFLSMRHIVMTTTPKPMRLYFFYVKAILERKQKNQDFRIRSLEKSYSSEMQSKFVQLKASISSICGNKRGVRNGRLMTCFKDRQNGTSHRCPLITNRI